MICDYRQYASQPSSAIFAGMSTVDLKRRLQIAGRTQEELAEGLGISAHSASRLVRGARKMSVEEQDKIELWFRSVGDSAPVDGQGKIPVFGYAAGNSGDRVAFTNDRALEWVSPPPLVTLTGPMAGLRVMGVSMEPRYFSGELAVVALHLHPARGADCVIEFQDGSADIKTYERSRDGIVFCRQWNPEQEVRYKAGDVRALHAVISRQ